MALNIFRGFPSFLVPQQSRHVTSHRKERVTQVKVRKFPPSYSLSFSMRKKASKQTNENNKTTKTFQGGRWMEEIDALHNLTHQQRNVLDKWLLFCQR